MITISSMLATNIQALDGTIAMPLCHTCRVHHTLFTATKTEKS